MAQNLREVMTPDPITVTATASLVDAAKAMRDRNVGDVIVTKNGGAVCGMLTDRDITIRAVADGRNPADVKVDEICTHEVVGLKPEDTVDDAVRLMRERAIRRVPILEGDRPVGVVAIGDLAVEKDPDSALADISAAPPND